MAYVIAEPCVDVMDQACVDVCPVDCIHFEEGKDRMLYIEPDECIDCGACEPECPVEAIFTEEDVPDEWKPYTEINVLWFNDKDDCSCQNQRDTARINCGYPDNLVVENASWLPQCFPPCRRLCACYLMIDSSVRDIT